MPSGFLIEFGLEIVLSFQRFRASGGRPSVDGVEPALQLRQRFPSIIAEDEWDRPRPSPRRHIEDSVLRAKQILLPRDLRVEYAIVASGLEQVALDGVVNALRRMMLEVHCLTRVGTDAGGDEHQPREQFAARFGRIVRHELAGFLSQVQQDGGAVEYANLAIHNDRYLGIRIKCEKLGLELIPSASIDGNQLVRQPRFLEEQCDLGRIGRRAKVKLDHCLQLSPQGAM